MCKKELTAFHTDIEKLDASMKAKNKEEVEREVGWMIKNVPIIERACHLEGACAKDVGMIGRMAMKMEKDLHRGTWDDAVKDYAGMQKMLA